MERFTRLIYTIPIDMVIFSAKFLQPVIPDTELEMLPYLSHDPLIQRPFVSSSF